MCQNVFVMIEQGYTTRSSPEYVDGWLGLMIGDNLWHAMWAQDQVAAVAAAIHVAIGPAASLPADAAAIPCAATVHPAPRAESVAVASTLTPPVHVDTQSHSQPAKPPATLSLSNSSLKHPGDLQELNVKSVCMTPAPSPAASAATATAVPAAAAAFTASPRLTLSSPSPSKKVQSPHSHAQGDDATAAALAAAHECLQDANKTRDSAALAALLQSLGVVTAADLAFVDDAATLSITALLKPTAANFFAITIGHAINIGYGMRAAQRSAKG